MDVSFNGDTKTITVNTGIIYIGVKELYSWWKEWSIENNNLKYLPAMRGVGGDPTILGQSLGSTFFLINGWRIRPFEGNHILIINGNLYTEDGSSPFLSTLGNYNVLINMTTSNIIDKVNVSGTETDLTPITNKLNLIDTKLNNQTEIINRLLDIQEGNWKIDSKQMIFYDRLGAELFRYNLYDKQHIPSDTAVFSREKV